MNEYIKKVTYIFYIPTVFLQCFVQRKDKYVKNVKQKQTIIKK